MNQEHRFDHVERALDGLIVAALGGLDAECTGADSGELLEMSLSEADLQALDALGPDLAEELLSQHATSSFGGECEPGILAELAGSLDRRSSLEEILARLLRAIKDVDGSDD